MVEHSTRGLKLVSTEREAPEPTAEAPPSSATTTSCSRSSEASRVLRCFSAEHPSLTLSEVARLTGLTRATARRLLLTFERLGYMRNDGRLFELTPLVLDLGYAYISSCKLPDLVQPDMEALSERCNESVSASVLDGRRDRLHRAGAHEAHHDHRARRSGRGSRRRARRWAACCSPIFPTTSCAPRLEAMTVRSAPTTPRSIPIDSSRSIGKVRSQGWAFVDQELEDGVRSVAAPFRDRSGRAIAAINVSTHAGRVSLDELQRARSCKRLLEACRRDQREARQAVTPAGDAILAMLLRLFAALRDGGVDVSFGEVLDAASAMRHVDLLDRDAFAHRDAGDAGQAARGPRGLLVAVRRVLPTPSWW